MNDPEIQAYDHLFVQGRPVWQPDFFDPPRQIETYRSLLKLVKSMQSQGGLVVVPFGEDRERAVLAALSFLMGRFLKQGVPCHYSQFGDPHDLRLPGLLVSYWIVHNAPRFEHLQLMLEAWLQPGRVVIASGATVEWERLSINIIHGIFHGFEKAPGSIAEELKEARETALEEDLQWLAKTGRERFSSIFAWTCLTEAWGALLPCGLGSRLSGESEESFSRLLSVAEENGIVFRLDPHKSCLATKGEQYAWACLKKYLQFNSNEMLAADLADNYRTLFGTVQFADEGERWTFLQIMQSWLTGSHKRLELNGPVLGRKTIEAIFLEVWAREGKEITTRCTPQEAVAWGKLMAALGSYEEAVEFLDAVLRRVKANRFLMHLKAHILAQWCEVWPEEQIYRRAREAFRESLERFPRNVYLLQSWGALESRSRNWRKAIAKLEEARSIDPRNPWILVARVDMLLDAGEYEKAERELKDALENFPPSPHVLHIFGRLAFFRGQWDRAEEYWEKLRDTFASNIYAWHSLGHMKRERGHWNDSLDSLEKAWKLDPENPVVSVELGTLFADLGNFCETWESFEARDRFLSHLETKSELLEAAGRNPELSPWNLRSYAAHFYDQALAVRERSLLSRLQRAVLFLSAGSLDEAEHHLTVLERELPDSIVVLHKVGRLCMALRKYGEAMARFDRILRRDPGNLWVRLSLAELELILGDSAASEELLRDFLNLFEEQKNRLPHHRRIAFWLTYGKLLHRHGLDLLPALPDVLARAKELDAKNAAVLAAEKWWR